MPEAMHRLKPEPALALKADSWHQQPKTLKGSLCLMIASHIALDDISLHTAQDLTCSIAPYVIRKNDPGCVLASQT